MKVLKFGGTSVGSPERLRRVFEIVKQAAQFDQLIVVVSAFSGVTNTLDALAQNAANGDDVCNVVIDKLQAEHLRVTESLIRDEKLRSEIIDSVESICGALTEICRGVKLVGELTARTSARILCAGELMSYSIVAGYFQSSGLECVGVDARDLIVTQGDLLAAKVIPGSTHANLADLKGRASVVVIPGFVARDEDGRTSTLGRGGSDYTAALAAFALSVSSLEIWTDVSGVMTADPRLVSRAHPIASLSYAEAMELSFFGAKVIYPPTIQPLVRAEIPIYIKNTLEPGDPGTMITRESKDAQSTVKGISSIPDIGLITVSGSGMIGVPGTAMRMFTAMSTHDLSVLFITQSSSEHTITVGLKEGDAIAAHGYLKQTFEFEMERGLIDEVLLETGLSLMAAVGDGMREHPGVAARLFGLLGENGINIRAIAQGSTERNVSFVVKS
ncbi:MAG: bifunctional aspartate kinase/homoserine dehydrogenase I, partial [Bacteroidetes bacterium]